MPEDQTIDRQRELGEVFTPPATVQEMLDLIPADTLTSPLQTALDPACGNGNILEALLMRKLQRLPSDFTHCAALICLSSVYGIDISPDNVEAAVKRQINALMRFIEEKAPHLPTGELRKPAEAIARANIVLGDTLNPDFIITEWEALPGIESFVKKEYAGNSIFAANTDLFSAKPVLLSESRPTHWRKIDAL